MTEPAKPVYEYPCTECGDDAYVAVGRSWTDDGGEIVKKGERLCGGCAAKRGFKGPLLVSS